ncbi:hypothetical protein MRB53_036962 [Persea americana]|nr:hypothetical protein MRB53_036962 [Persea americana]
MHASSTTSATTPKQSRTGDQRECLCRVTGMAGACIAVISHAHSRSDWHHLSCNGTALSGLRHGTEYMDTSFDRLEHWLPRFHVYGNVVGTLHLSCFGSFATVPLSSVLGNFTSIRPPTSFFSLTTSLHIQKRALSSRIIQGISAFTATECHRSAQILALRRLSMMIIEHNGATADLLPCFSRSSSTRHPLVNAATQS